MTTRAPALLLTTDRIRNFIESNYFVWQVTSLVNPYAWASQCALSSLVCLGQLFAPLFMVHIVGNMWYLWGFLSFFQWKSSLKPDEFCLMIDVCRFHLHLQLNTSFCNFNSNLPLSSIFVYLYQFLYFFHLFPPPSQYLCIGPHPFHTLLPPTPN